jgi:hypothetical protein
VTRYHLAQLNVGTVRAPVDSAELAGFMAGIEPVNAVADAAPGFVWRLQDGDGPGATALRPRGPDFMVNMSVWESLEALWNFVYRNGPHLDFMRRRREWFHRMAEQYLVLWWVPAGHIPSLDEALARLDLLQREGPGPEAFTFREPYPAPGDEAMESGVTEVTGSTQIRAPSLRPAPLPRPVGLPIGKFADQLPLP